MSKQTRRRYSEQFKADAVKLVEEHGYGVSEASRRLEIDRSVLARWRREAQDGTGEKVPATGDEREAELRALREEVRKLRMERDILKKATAFFAKESN